MVRTLLLASSSTSSSSDTTTTASRDSTGSSNDSHSSFSSDLVLLAECDSSRPSSVTEEDDLKRPNQSQNQNQQIKKPKYFSLARFSSAFRKDSKSRDQENVSGSSVKRVISKYLKKVKPLYEKLSQKQQQIKIGTMATSKKDGEICVPNSRKDSNGGFSHSFSGNLRYPRRRSCISSCPSSMRSSPTHSGVLCRNGGVGGTRVAGTYHSDSSSMEELQSAIQGAIAHCKNSMIQ
ncbi:hypothetical protein HHK36_026699 [Tetracentron sinense]|uniref:Membrane-associated kinase regulator 1 n=1 Tax=Tetracentron sinense TaxID=13715 RepID=A0A835D2G5_TETSI|nr:hypothetical protein HHK36_026699 [Tetracentron sinense]